jgi:molybdopterin-guanine dinucleotide biosynthesis protein A
MGEQKALLSLGGSAIIEIQLALLKEIFDEIIIVTNAMDAFRNIDAKIIRDLIPDQGPLGGLYSGLAVSSNIQNFLIGCDMPFVNIELIQFMISQIEENDIVIPETSIGLETLFAFYSINCFESIRFHVELGKLKLADILESQKVRYIAPEEIHALDPDELSFFNINTPKDYEEAKILWQKLRKRNRAN